MHSVGAFSGLRVAAGCVMRVRLVPARDSPRSATAARPSPADVTLREFRPPLASPRPARIVHRPNSFEATSLVHR